MIKVIEDFLTEHEYESISNFILENEEYVKSLGPDNYSGTSNDSLTGRFEYFNYLYYRPGDILVNKFSVGQTFLEKVSVLNLIFTEKDLYLLIYFSLEIIKLEHIMMVLDYLKIKRGL